MVPRHALITPMNPVEAEPSPLQGYVTRYQLATLYKVAETTIAVWQRRDSLPVHRVGTQPLYLLDEVETWFNARRNCMHGGYQATPEVEALLNQRYQPRGLR